MRGTLSEQSDWVPRTSRIGDEDPRISSHGCPLVALFKAVSQDVRRSSITQASSHISKIAHNFKIFNRTSNYSRRTDNAG